MTPRPRYGNMSTMASAGGRQRQWTFLRWNDGHIPWWCHSQVTRYHCSFCLAEHVSRALRSTSPHPRRWRHARSTTLHTLTCPLCTFLPRPLQTPTPTWQSKYAVFEPISDGGGEFVVNYHCSCQLHFALIKKRTILLTRTITQKSED